MLTTVCLQVGAGGLKAAAPWGPKRTENPKLSILHIGINYNLHNRNIFGENVTMLSTLA